MKRFAYFFGFFFLTSLLFHAPSAKAQGTFTAASCNQSAVNAVINGPTHKAVNGDTIHIPAGSCTWTSGISVPNGIGITIMGAGTPGGNPATVGADSSCTATTITDELSGGSLITMSPTFGASLSRISCMKIAPFLPRNGYAQPISVDGTCTSSGCPNFRMDNLTIPSAWSGIGVSDDTFGNIANVFGVADHNNVGDTLPGGNGVVLANVSHGKWLGVNHWGDNSWAAADSFGTNRAFYLENNRFTYGIGTDTDSYGADYGGGRYVCRFNTFNNVLGTGACANHGLDTTGRPRGGRQVEAYYNTGSQTAGSTAFGSRSGVGIIFGNSWSNSGGTLGALANLDPQRRWRPNARFGGCNGASVWDTNDGTTYHSGTIISLTSIGAGFPNGNGYIILDSSLTSGQWMQNGSPYSVYDPSKGSGAEITASIIGSVNTNVPDEQHGFAPSSGDSYQILRSTACMDQPARSGGALLEGGDSSGTVTEGLSNPACTSTGSPCAVSQVLDPWYEGADVLPSSSSSTIAAATGSIIRNRDYYSETVNQSAQTSSSSPFNGTSGSGHGTLANRPTTCTKGVGYFAMDQGTWNTFDSNKQGELFVCTSTNTWTLYYTPYTYPHPVISGTSTSGNPPNPPTALLATVQ